MTRYASCACVLLFASVIAMACGPRLAANQALELTVVRTGWYESGVVDGKIKLVPTVSLRLKNVSPQRLPSLQVNAVFRRVGDDGEWGSGFVAATGSAGLLPGRESDPLTIASPLGYTGTDSRFDLLRNSHFVDARVTLFAKYGSTQWARIGEAPITRQLIER